MLARPEANEMREAKPGAGVDTTNEVDEEGLATTQLVRNTSLALRLDVGALEGKTAPADPGHESSCERSSVVITDEPHQ